MFGKQIKNWTKGPSSSPVCDADIAVNDLLRERLAASGNAFAWLSEESADDARRLGERHVWVVDPIGGNSHDWDLAAADLLVHEAGGALTPLAGGTVVYNRSVPRHGTLVAAGRDRHAALIKFLGDQKLLGDQNLFGNQGLAIAIIANR